MENTVTGVALTIVAPFVALGLATVARKLGAGAEGSRKLAHILLSNWILLALAVYRSAWAACILPACFIPLNYLSYRRGIFSAIERDEDNSLGTVWYAVSLFLLCFAGYSLDMPWIAACGMLAMGYGDGLGTLVGKRWGRSRFPGAHSLKSLEGMLAVMLFSGLAVGVVCAVYAPHAYDTATAAGAAAGATAAAGAAPYTATHFALRAALACAVPAGVIELFSPRGTDNLTLPIGVSLIVFLLARFPTLWPVFACLGAGLFILVVAYCFRAVTFSALLAGTLLGVALFVFSGWLGFAALVLFFLLGSAASRIGHRIKEEARSLHERQGARAIAQVAANGAPSLIFGALYHINGRESCLIAVLACFAAASADTLSSEIGMLSKKEPVSILTRKPILQGLSGGITLLGFSGAAIGALAVSLLAVPGFGILGAAVVFAGGAVGSVLDSVLGASVQAKYRLKSGNGGEETSRLSLTERKSLYGSPLELAHGFRWVTNDLVNFVSSLVIGAISAFIW